MNKLLKSLVPAGLRRRAHEKKRTHAEAAMKRIAQRGLQVSTVIDVGASDGRWSAQVMGYVPDAAYVLVEANQNHRPALASFCVSHPRTRFVMAAASDRSGTIRFDASDLFGGKAAPEPESSAQEVEAVRLDDIVTPEDGPFLVKLDTHGHELPILEGAERCLGNAALVVIETYGFRIAPEAMLFHEMVAHMREKGFGVVDMSDPLWRPKDGCLWQMDLYFQPLTRPEFNSATYF